MTPSTSRYTDIDLTDVFKTWPDLQEDGVVLDITLCKYIS